LGKMVDAVADYLLCFSTCLLRNCRCNWLLRAGFFVLIIKHYA
jgi:hypothetical protein